MAYGKEKGLGSALPLTFRSKSALRVSTVVVYLLQLMRRHFKIALFLPSRGLHAFRVYWDAVFLLQKSAKPGPWAYGKEIH